MNLNILQSLKPLEFKFVVGVGLFFRDIALNARKVITNNSTMLVKPDASEMQKEKSALSKFNKNTYQNTTVLK